METFAIGFLAVSMLVGFYVGYLMLIALALAALIGAVAMVAIGVRWAATKLDGGLSAGGRVSLAVSWAGITLLAPAIALIGVIEGFSDSVCDTVLDFSWKHLSMLPLSPAIGCWQALKNDYLRPYISYRLGREKKAAWAALGSDGGSAPALATT